MILIRRPLAGLALFVSLAFGSRPLLAQALADRVPAAAVVYVGWAGADNPGSGYAGSHLKGVVEASDLAKFFNDFLPKVIERAARGEAGGAEALAGLSATAHMWRHPVALYFTGMEMNAPAGPYPRMTVVCRAGADADALERQLRDAVSKQPAGPLPAQIFRDGDLVGMTNERGGAGAPIAGGAADSLAGNARFKAALTLAGKEPALIAYADVEALVGIVNDALQKGGDAAASEAWPRVREASGIDGLKRFVWTEGFDGKDWGTHVFLDAPAPRKGVLGMFGGAPIGDGVARAVPATATLAGATRFDLGGLFDGIRGVAATIDPNAAAQFDAVTRQISAMIGMDVRKDLLGSLGSEWAYYSDPLTGGRGATGFVFVNRLRDEAKAVRALDRFGDAVNQIIAARLPDSKVRVKQASVQGVAVHYVGIPLVTPSWAIDKGNLYLALYPQVAAAAVSQSAGGKKSILDNKDFVALRQRLGGGRAAEWHYMDLPKTAPGSYQTWLMVTSLAKFGDVFGIESPPVLFPTMDTLLAHLGPAGSVSWSDDRGLHFRAVSPFPAATVLAADTGGLDMQSTAFMTSMLLPALNRAREQANRVKSASNLRELAKSVQLYANDNKGRFPPDLATLINQGRINPEELVSPRTSTSLPRGLSKERLAQWADASADYVYLGAGKNWRTPADYVLAYEKPDRLSDGINVAFVDGRVHFVPMPQAMQMIKAGRGHPSDEPPGIGR